MKPSELFGVAVRAIGLWEIVTAVIEAMTLLILPPETWGRVLAIAAIRVGVGLILFMNANGFVLAGYYGKEKLSSS